jgi:hypothetical protein
MWGDPIDRACSRLSGLSIIVSCARLTEPDGEGGNSSFLIPRGCLPVSHRIIWPPPTLCERRRRNIVVRFA